MPVRTGVAHVVTTTRTYKDRVYRTHLLRRSYREGGTVKNEPLGNLSHLPEALVEIIRRALQGETFVPLTQAFEIARSLAHGHVHAVHLAMVAARILCADTTLAATRRWHTSTLARGCPVAISVHPGNTADSTTFLPEVTRLREQFGIQRMVVVGDRGMISQKAVDAMSHDRDIDWVTALRSTRPPSAPTSLWRRWSGRSCR